MTFVYQTNNEDPAGKMTLFWAILLLKKGISKLLNELVDIHEKI